MTSATSLATAANNSSELAPLPTSVATRRRAACAAARPRLGGGQFGAALGIRDRGGHQLGELLDPLLRVRGRLVIPSPAHADHAPTRAADDDRPPDRGVDVVATE